MVDYYELLGIKKEATEQEIKSAYRQMAKKYHPDINKTEEASKIIISLNEAKETLLDKEKREEYNILLEEIKHSKQVSKNKEETYSAKTAKYKENYAETYVTKWQFLINYLKNGLDKKSIKLLKCILVTLNFIAFTLIKGLTICIVYFLCIIENFIDYLVGLVMFLAILALFIMTKETSPNYLPYIPANIEMFLILSLIATGVEILKTFIITKSINLYVLLQNVEDKIFVKILMK